MPRPSLEGWNTMAFLSENRHTKKNADRMTAVNSLSQHSLEHFYLFQGLS